MFCRRVKGLCEQTRACGARMCAPNAALDSVPADVSQRVRLVDGLVLYRFGANAGKLGPTSGSRASGACASRNARRSV